MAAFERCCRLLEYLGNLYLSWTCLSRVLRQSRTLNLLCAYTCPLSVSVSVSVQLEVSVNTRHNALYHFGGMLEKLIRKGLGYLTMAR